MDWLHSRRRHLGRGAGGDLGRVARHGPRGAGDERAGRRRGCGGARLPTAVELLRSRVGRRRGTVDGDGLVVAAIPESARLIYVTPSHQYPLGVVLSRDRRLELLRWAARHDATIVEDDYDSQFRYAARPLEPLQRLDTDGRVVTSSRSRRCCHRRCASVSPSSVQHHPGGDRVARSGRLVSAMADPVDPCSLHRRGSSRPARRPRSAADRARQEEIVRRLRCSLVPVRPLPCSAGLHVAVLVDGDETGDDRALHEASVAEDVIVGSLRRC